VQLATDVNNNAVQTFVFNLQAEGSYNDMLNFTTELAAQSRIMTVESMEIGRDSQTNNLILTLRGRQYFKS